MAVLYYNHAIEEKILETRQSRCGCNEPSVLIKTGTVLNVPARAHWQGTQYSETMRILPQAYMMVWNHRLSICGLPPERIFGYTYAGQKLVHPKVLRFWLAKRAHTKSFRGQNDPSSSTTGPIGDHCCDLHLRSCSDVDPHSASHNYADICNFCGAQGSPMAYMLGMQLCAYLWQCTHVWLPLCTAAEAFKSGWYQSHCGSDHTRPLDFC